MGHNPFVEDVVDITDIDCVNSFQCEFKGGSIYVLSDGFSSTVFIQPRKDAALTSLPATSGKISQLKNVIKDDIDSIDDFLDVLYSRAPTFAAITKRIICPRIYTSVCLANLTAREYKWGLVLFVSIGNIGQGMSAFVGAHPLSLNLQV